MVASLKVRVLSIHWKNIRAFGDKPPIDAPEMNGEAYVDFPKEDNLFLQMPNGTGKTTTLHLLRSAFIGKLWTPTGSEPNPKIWRRIVGENEDDEFVDHPSLFKVRLEINGEKWGFELHLDHEDNSHEWWTDSPSGRRQGWVAPKVFRRAFRNNPRLVELFIFDAETSRLMTTRTDRHLIDEAIRQFAGVSSVFDLIGQPDNRGSYDGGLFEGIKNELTQDYGKISAKGGGKLTNWSKCLVALDEVEIELKENLELRRESLRGVSERLEEIQTELDTIEENHGSAFEDSARIKDDIQRLDEECDQATKEMLREILNPLRTFEEMWKEMALFHENHQDRKLPAGVGRGWLMGLCDQEDCICGTPLDSKMKEHIKMQTDALLDQDKMIAVSEMQSSFKSSPVADRGPLSAIKARVSELSTDLAEQKNLWETEFSAKSTETAKKRRAELDKEKGQLIIRRSKLEAEIKVRATTNMVWLHGINYSKGLTQSGNPTESLAVISEIENLTIVNKVRANIESKLTDAQGNKDIWDGLVQARGIIGESLSKLSEEMRTEVSEQATKVWGSMPAAGAEGNLRIKIEGDGLRLYRGSSNNEPTGVSGAQVVSACYSITKAIGDMGDISFPLICDTPFAGYDEGMYKPWYQNITKSFGQCIALINTAEKRVMQSEVWDQGLGDDDYRATIHSPGRATDGGKKLVFSEERALFDNIKSATDRGD